MPTLQQLLNLDATPLDTDWDDIHDLWDDMEKFGQTHPGHMFICADDPGCNHDPPRVGRLGWVAYRDNPNEQVKMWTITVSNVKRTARRKPTRYDMSDRQKMLEQITIRDD
jgi:hypothetical protein